jgi:hypothetical protein
MLNVRGSSDNSLSEYNELDHDRALVERYDRTRGTSRENTMVDGTFGFRSLFKPQQHELSAEVRFSRQDDRDRTTLWLFRIQGTAASTASSTTRTRSPRSSPHSSTTCACSARPRNWRPGIGDRAGGSTVTMGCSPTRRFRRLVAERPEQRAGAGRAGARGVRRRQSERGPAAAAGRAARRARAPRLLAGRWAGVPVHVPQPVPQRTRQPEAR